MAVSMFLWRSSSNSSLIWAVNSSKISQNWGFFKLNSLDFRANDLFSASLVVMLPNVGEDSFMKLINPYKCLSRKNLNAPWEWLTRTTMDSTCRDESLNTLYNRFGAFHTGDRKAQASVGLKTTGWRYHVNRWRAKWEIRREYQLSMIEPSLIGRFWRSLKI